MRNGLKICRPTGSPAIVVTGSGSQTASIVGQGSVQFANATSLSLNNIFSSEYSNYILTINLRSNTQNADVFGRLRLSGTDNSGANYTVQELSSNGTAVTGVRLSSQTSMTVCTTDNRTERGGATCYIYGPNLAQPTAFRTVGLRTDSGAWVQHRASTHSLSTAYDGITLTASGGSLTGSVTVYGLVD